MTHSMHEVRKPNTCYTGMMTFIKAGDTIQIADITYNRYVLLDSSKSFFGLFKLGETRPQRF